VLGGQVLVGRCLVAGARWQELGGSREAAGARPRGLRARRGEAAGVAVAQGRDRGREVAEVSWLARAGRRELVGGRG
jgi:hypothetical protein